MMNLEANDFLMVEGMTRHTHTQSDKDVFFSFPRVHVQYAYGRRLTRSVGDKRGNGEKMAETGGEGGSTTANKRIWSLPTYPCYRGGM